MKKRVTGFGGFFFKANDPEHIKQWYGRHLGLPIDQYGCSFWWKEENGEKGSTHWSPMKDDTSYFDPSEKPPIFFNAPAIPEGLRVNCTAEASARYSRCRDTALWMILPRNTPI